MERKIQGSNELLVRAEPEVVWEVIVDPARVPEYMRAVKRIDAAEERERVGAVRSCWVEMGGKKGEVVERCVDLVPNRVLTHVMDRDAFGFSRFFDDFGFSFVLEPQEQASTLVRLEGFYREKGLPGRVLNALVMRRKLHRLRGNVLGQLKAVVE
jgi:uncharacterized protein YndB with AHSA1/START domain